jgi:hypothetical protein
MVRTILTAVLAAGLVLAPAPAAAHEVPASVTVRAFVRPDGGTLRFLVRVPLESLRDVDIRLSGEEFLDLRATEPVLPDAVRQWIADYLVLYEDGRRIEDARVAALRIGLPSDPSFATYAEALANVRSAGLPATTRLPWRQALVDVLLEYPITDANARFSIDYGLAHLGVRTTTVLRFLPAEGGERVFHYVGDPGLVRLDPRWHQAAFTFVKLGFRHILEGIDHILFLLCLVIPFRRLRPLILVVTAFTVAHSITLIASALGLAPNALWFPPLIETLIAASIVYMAFENIVHAQAESSEARAASGRRWLERRWLFAFVFGLVHGFGFSFMLSESLQFAGAHLLTSLLAFNIGVELGQVLVVAVAVPLLAVLFSRVVPARIGAILVSALVAHTAWHWMADRASALRQYRFQAPAFDLTLLATAMRWGMLFLIAGGAVWVLAVVYRRYSADQDPLSNVDSIRYPTR